MKIRIPEGLRETQKSYLVPGLVSRGSAYKREFNLAIPKKFIQYGMVDYYVIRYLLKKQFVQSYHVEILNNQFTG